MTTAPTASRRRHHVVQAVALLVVATLLGLVVHTLAGRRAAAEPAMPTDQRMEQQLGVRFSRVAVVADGGLVQVSYVVLDSDKATRFQDDRANLPVLANPGTGASTQHVALMKQGHSLPVGQSFYFVYQNNGTVHPHDQATISTHGLSLTGVPVE
ncbi:hypothetical protein [Lapillicoccus jejuensis]|uniref:Uncharacterized protein n=1 Tax=Lapillicoccus jejuensis TaxID=402171 RepID=A0A542E2Y2_9MICO|nr:hypothetical protein [Lapillicoccus jejuensis]TQJ09682.1 hypothetical protein FB458_2795 [Lapillicoccus jejuensis]